jgi:hypothetical protein
MTGGRLKGALVSYAVLAGISLAVLDGRYLGIILILFGGLAVKSWLGYKKEQLEEADRPPEDSQIDGDEPH